MHMTLHDLKELDLSLPDMCLPNLGLISLPEKNHGISDFKPFEGYSGRFEWLLGHVILMVMALIIGHSIAVISQCLLINFVMLYPMQRILLVNIICHQRLCLHLPF